jgi:hypothetical protein
MKPRAADVAYVELVTGPAPGGPVAARLLIWSET